MTDKIDTTLKLHRLNSDRKVESFPLSEILSDKLVIIFGLPGAFTPTCSNSHLPLYDEMYDQFKEQGIDEIYCLSVNDPFVMDAWFKDKEIKNVKPLCDGNLTLTKHLEMDVSKHGLGFGRRSWRYSMLVEDGKVLKVFEEDTNSDEADPYYLSKATFMMDYLTL